MNLAQLEQRKKELELHIKEVRLQHDNMIKLKRAEKLVIMTDIKNMLEEKKQIIRELMNEKKEVMKLIREHKKKPLKLKSKSLQLKNVEYPYFPQMEIPYFEQMEIPIPQYEPYELSHMNTKLVGSKKSKSSKNKK
jgi:hypothetical protein